MKQIVKEAKINEILSDGSKKKELEGWNWLT